MNLEELVKKGSIGSVEYVDKEIVWDENSFTVSVKSKITPADFEYCYISKTDDDSIAARRVHRSILLDGGESIPYEDALSLKPELLYALISAINEVQGDAEKKS